MHPLKIYSDSPLGEAALALLKRGTLGHELVFPEMMADSVLGQSIAGPEIKPVDVAFGQPELDSVLSAGQLKWLHLSSAGYTRYDRPEFREEMMKRGICVTNSSSVYADALKSGHLAAAWLDVTDPEPLPDDHVLWTCSNCHITPHTAGGHQAESHTLVRHFLENLKRYLAGETLLDRIM